jgi:TolB-like protein/lipoprotein NlpI
VTEPSRAVFLSYASQDAQAAQRVCEALRNAGIEVWFDQSELRGGDVWDQKIRREIRDCALFIPVISANTASRHEGYFRLEWDLADQRTHMMARNRVFIVPVSPDATPDAGADVPESFQRVQWTRLPNGETSPAFVERVQRLLSPEPSTKNRAPASAQPGAVGIIRAPEEAYWSRKRGLLVAVALVVLGAVAYLAIETLWNSKHAASPTVAASPAPASFTPPPHSIAVLPFVNMSGDKAQEYFSDGLTEELLNSLAEINELQVAARTSAFSFKGKDTDIGTIARKLNVGAVLEGSVRRSGNTVRITTQLINAVTGYHLWSHTYDRDLGDVLKLETEIAGAVASALKVSLLGDEATKIEVGGTRNPAAFDAYLRGRKAYLAAHGLKDYQAAIAAYTEAIGLDPTYALAFANRSIALTSIADEGSGPEVRENFDRAHADARKAIMLAPDLAEGHTALALYFETGLLDFSRANAEFERALALAPGNARALSDYAHFAASMGHFDAGIAAARHAVVLDPLNRVGHFFLGEIFHYAGQNKEAIAAFQDALAVDPDYPAALAYRGLVYYALGDFERARASCEIHPDDWATKWCLAVTYNKLNRQADAEAILAKLKAAQGDAAAYQYATIYAQWGNVSKALEWLDKAMSLRDSGLEQLKVDPLMDPLRKEPRFQAVMRELKFPE